MTYRYIARDGAGIPRVWGEGPTADIAETECRAALRDYLTRRRDLRADQFTIVPEGR